MREFEDDTLRKHAQEKRKMQEELRSPVRFQQMKYMMDCGFNILVHGVGSKRELINRFVTSQINNEPCLIVNGFHSGTSIKSIVHPMMKFANKNMYLNKHGGSLSD